MRKADIANTICEKVGVSKTEAMDMVEYILNILKGGLQKGEAIKIAGFGNFIVRKKGERKGRNRRVTRKQRERVRQEQLKINLRRNATVTIMLRQLMHLSWGCLRTARA